LGYEPNELPTAPLRDVLWVQRYGFYWNLQIISELFFIKDAGFCVNC
jgi:hypothetical protein